MERTEERPTPLEDLLAQRLVGAPTSVTHGYERGLVLEQDTAITADEPAVESGPMLEARQSIAFLHNSAPTTQEVNR